VAGVGPARLSGKEIAVKIDVHVLVTEEEGIFNATCLEMGLATAGPDFETVTQDMVTLIVAHLKACEKEGRPEDAFVPAPPEYWKTYAQAIWKKVCRSRKLDLPSSAMPRKHNLLSDLAVRSYVCSTP
jgi:hypothetical protein